MSTGECDDYVQERPLDLSCWTFPLILHDDYLVQNNRSLHLPKNSEPAVLNHTISPMLSLRTSFESILSDLQVRHETYAELLKKNNPLKTCLALKFPAFTCEVKLDGERLLAHVHRGVVKVQVRFQYIEIVKRTAVCCF